MAILGKDLTKDVAKQSAKPYRTSVPSSTRYGTICRYRAVCRKREAHVSFSSPRNRRIFSTRSAEKPTGDGLGLGEQRQISKFSLFFFLFFFLP
ncbi:hypothetical protein GW17_00006176 [Ensete ventricosum]|nr:hypothetical protein GW17_00006176 [Ensete ventricosum]